MRQALVAALAFLTLAKAGCPPPLQGCGDACFSTDMYCCENGVLTQKQFCGGNGGGNGGGGNGGGGGGGNIPGPNNSGGDIVIKNNCGITLFIEARMGGDGRPLPGQSGTITKLPAGQKTGYTIPNEGASGTRFWAKYGCNDAGRNCLIGESQQYWPNPPGGCPPGGCQIPVDSLFEATWGCKPGSSCHSSNPTTWFDTSQVDGWTIPYKVNLFGATDQCDCAVGRCTNLTTIDGSHLDLARCPKNDDASWGGKFPNFGGRSMQNLDLRVMSNNLVLGCMSPCKKLTYGAPFGFGINEGTIPAVYMCCPTPTPNNCGLPGCISPTDCRNGPIGNTQFVKAVHDMAPGIYSYSYDDGVGLHTCPAGSVKYEMEFCPPGSTGYPLHV